MVLCLAACRKTGNETAVSEITNEEHDPITIMSANKDYTGFIEYIWMTTRTDERFLSLP